MQIKNNKPFLPHVFPRLRDDLVVNTLPQRHSKMSNGRLPMVSCLPHGGRLSEDSPAQGDSGISKLGGAMGIMRIMGKGHKNKNSPAQRDSIMSNPGMGLIGLMGPIGLMGKQPVNENSPAQAGSNISKLVLSLCLAGCQASPAMRDVSVFKAVQRDSGDNMRGDLPPVVYNIWSAQSTKY